MRKIVATLMLCASALPAAASEDHRAHLVETGRALYTQRCGHCHADQRGSQSLAAPLYDVFGRKAGSAQGYVFTPRITMLDLVWSEQTLWSWIQTTTFDTPLISMRHVGVKDQASADALVAYLASINARRE